MRCICSSEENARLAQLADPARVRYSARELPQWPVIVIHLLWLYFTISPWSFLITDCRMGTGPRPDLLRRMLRTGRLLIE